VANERVVNIVAQHVGHENLEPGSRRRDDRRDERRSVRRMTGRTRRHGEILVTEIRGADQVISR